MFDYFTELMLIQYFTIDAIFGRYIDDEKTIFLRLAKIYLLSEGEAEELYGLTEREEVKDISSENAYFQYRRTKQLLALDNRSLSSDEVVDEIIDIKGNAISAAKKQGIYQDSAISKFAAINLLTWAADSGLVKAMSILGILQHEGIIFVQDGDAGLKNITKSAKWNSDQALMAALYYDRAGRSEYLARIIANLLKGSHTQALALVKAAYGDAPRKADKTYYLLEKAFDSHILKPEVYSKQFARILFSDVISHRDKESLFFSGGKEAFACASDLPLKLSPAQAVTYDGDIADIMRPYHKEDVDKVVSCLENSDLRKLPTYRPLCVVSDSPFILENFAENVKKCLSGCHVEFIEVSDLAEYDIEPTKNNIFVRNCDEDKVNVYIIFFRGDIHERVFEMGKNFLQTEKRAKFRLLQPGICINLSAIMPICFCDKDNAKLLRPYCDVININGFTAQEKNEITDKILTDKGQLYGVEEISVEQPVYDRLADYSPEEIERVLDSIVCDNRKLIGALNLTEAILTPYLRERAQTHNTYGFGGGAHE